MDCKILPIAKEHIESYWSTLDFVAREGKYLGFYEAPPIEGTTAWVTGNIENDIAQFVAVVGGKVVGWCDISPEGSRPANRHIGGLGIGLLPEFRGRGIGAELMK